jgi:putative glutamine amidotransferase
MLRPRIGITRKGGIASEAQEAAHRRYRARVAEAGGEPVDLSASTKDTDREIQELGIQGLVFTGGGDLNPQLYGQQNHASRNIDDERDRFEINLLRLALDHDLPVLAICRGFQVLNVACGGMLLQDIAPPYREHAAGRNQTSAEHDIDVIKDSRLYAILKKTSLKVNSRHHQAVTRERTACSLVATAFSAGEDIVEAVEKTGNTWLVGVQWHPERTEDKIGNSFWPLFEDFVRAAAARSRVS